MSRDIENTFKEKLYECQKHVEKITISKKHLSSIMPLSIESYLKLNDVDMSFIDQLIFRFSKLQDYWFLPPFSYLSPRGRRLTEFQDE